MAHMALGNFGQPCTHFILAYFYSFNFQLSANKNEQELDILQMLTFSTCYVS